jgi:hypothetical protein
MSDLTPTHEITQMAAKLWQATAVVLLCMMDTSPPKELIALDDYHASAADFEDYGALASDHLAANVVKDFAHIEDDWATHKRLSSSLVHAGADPALGAAKRAALGRQLWRIALKIDQDLEALRARVAT